MKAYLVIPMGGIGERFLRRGYKTYKSFLPINRTTIFENIISNFKYIDLEVILIANFKTLDPKYRAFYKKKGFHLININNHKFGPLYSIFLAFEKIKNIIKKNKNIFISYSDINWSWDFKLVKNFFLKKEVVIFTHSGFHPHIEIDSKSDFCEKKNNKINKILEKSTISNDYKKDLLAVGCYYFKDLSYLNLFFTEDKIFKKNKEYYIVSLIQYLIKKKVNITNFNLKKFVHLGTPEQYEDFLNWENFFNKESISKKFSFKTFTSIMLMGGKGKRVSEIKTPKPLLLIENRPIYKHIFKKLNAPEKIIIANDKFNKHIDNKKFKIFHIKKTNSLFETIDSSKKLLLSKSNFFLTSCDCFGIFDRKDLTKKINNKKIDIIFFAFKYSNLQKNLGNSHTQLIIKEKKLYDIEVKTKYKNSNFGHAGFFWVRKGAVFSHLLKFQSSNYFKTLSREIIIDDYFKFLINKKLIIPSYVVLNHYVHIGSAKEYLEYKYWENYFKHNK